MKKIFLKATLGLATLSALYFQQNKIIKTRNIVIDDKNLPKEFNNFKIAHISDIHCDSVGFSDSMFINKLKNFSPDIIVITGDVLDSYNNDMEFSYNILSQIHSVAPCYFVSGNHEIRLLDEYAKLKDILYKLNITNLNNKNIILRQNSEKIYLVGVEDYDYFRREDELSYKDNFKLTLESLYTEDNYNILLSHRPEKFDIYKKQGFNLILSGHAHGGQWRVPFIGGIFSPSQGFFPRFTHGVYKEKNTSLVVSQGLGNSSFSLRINNRRELVFVTLKNK